MKPNGTFNSISTLSILISLTLRTLSLYLTHTYSDLNSAAAQLMEMASARFICVILVCVLFLLKGEGGSKVPITRLKSAVKKGAVCLDGSPPAYHFDKGTGKGANSWLVHLEGGAWCETVEKCMSRTHATNGLGSSFLMNKTTFRGILSKARKYNPNFYNWNRILVRYCDGSSFTGDVEQVNWGHSKLYFRGARIFDVIVEDLLQKGMINASNALLSGNSAGGLASIIHCDKFQAFLPFTRRVKCFSDAGYFMHARDISGKYHYQEVMFDRVVSLHGSIKNLPRGCTSRMKPSLCFYPQFIAPTIHTPLFILNSAYDVWQVPYILALTNIDAGRSWVGCQWNTKNCTSSQIKILEGFRAELVHELISASHSSTGFFINSCYTHCQSLHQKKWLGNPTSTVNNKSISEAVGEWYYDRSVVQLIDHQYRLPHWCVIDKSEPNPDNNYTWN